MADKPIDFEAHRNLRKGSHGTPRGNPEEVESMLCFCECGCSTVQIWTDGVVECSNCRGELEIDVGFPAV